MTHNELEAHIESLLDDVRYLKEEMLNAEHEIGSLQDDVQELKDATNQ